MRNNYILISILSLLMIVSIVYAFFIAGLPSEIRGRKFDKERISQMKSLKSGIDGYYGIHTKLPLSLDELTQDRAYSSYTRYIKDPETKKDFDYIPIDKTSYKLCTDFSENPEENQIDRYSSGELDFKNYKKGYHCFTLYLYGYEPGNVYTITPTGYFYQGSTPSPTLSPAVTPTIGISDRKDDSGVPYFVIVGKYTGVVSQYEFTVETKDKYSDTQVVKIQHDQDKETIFKNKNGEMFKFSNYIVGDLVQVDANVKVGESYRADFVQNLSR